MAKSENARPEYQLIIYAFQERPVDFDESKPGPSAVKLASEKFGIPEAEFNPKHGGRCYGWTRYGFTCEVCVKWALAESIAGRRIPEILNVFE